MQVLRASAETLLEVARDPSHLGAELGFFSVLHTCENKRPINHLACPPEVLATCSCAKVFPVRRPILIVIDMLNDFLVNWPEASKSRLLS